MMKTLRLILSLAALCCLPAVYADNALEIISLKSRSAEEMIALIRPLLGPGDALTGTGYQLIIRTDASTLQQVRAILDQLDRAPQNLLITVRRDAPSREQQRGIDVSGEVRVGDHTGVRVGDAQQSGLQLRAQDRLSTQQDDASQRLRVLEGQRGFISMGQSVAYPSNSVVVQQGTPVIQQGLEYRELRSGFYVLPRLAGETVTLQIEPVNERLQSDHSVSVQQAQTVVSGRLGEWMALGGVSEQRSESHRGVLSTQQRHSETHLGFWVKVERVP